jgi:hypothetical protein
MYSICEFVEILHNVMSNSNKNYMKISDVFLTEMQNMEIKKKNGFIFINGKTKVSKPKEDTKLLQMKKSNNKPRNINNKLNNSKPQKKTQNPNPLNSSNALTLLKDNVLALFPCDGHMAIFDDIENIIRIFMTHCTNSKDEIISVLNATSFNIEQAYFDLQSGQKKYSFTNSEDYIIKHMKNTEEFQKLIEYKGINNVIKREQYLQINNN